MSKIISVPMVFQLEMLECGAASLSMILRYYGKYLTLEQVRTDCGVSRDGVSANDILKAARHYGLNAAGYSCSIDDLRVDMDYPCIIHWGFNHFVVLRGLDEKYAYLNDPARGAVRLSLDEFSKKFTGIVLTFQPSEGFEKSGRKESYRELIRDTMKGTGSLAVFVGLFTIIDCLAGLIEPGFDRVFYDRLLNRSTLEWFIPFLCLLGGFYLIRLLSDAIRSIYTMKLSGRLYAQGTASFMWKALNLPMRFYSQRMAGDVLQRKAYHSELADTMVNSVVPLVFKSVSMVFYLIILLRYSVPLTALVLGSIGINAVLLRQIAKKQAEISRVSVNDSAKQNATAVSGFRMIETIKASGAEDGFFRKWSGYQAAAADQTAKAGQLSATIGLLPKLISEFTSAFIMLLCLYMVIRGDLTIGMVTAFQGYVDGFMAPASLIASLGNNLLAVRMKSERIDDVMKYESDQVLQDDSFADYEDVQKLSGNIEIKNVTFGYNPVRKPLIRDFSMTIRKGSKVALVGASGCGKSTIAKLISGLYVPWSGEITFDGVPLSRIGKNVFRSSLSVVDQSITVFEDSVRNNIKMWDDSIQDFEMILACRDAQIHSDIVQKEGNYSHVFAEGGKDFSGGQRQRLEIARVLAQDPTIVILDEATSALDAKTEYDVAKAITDRGITCIIVAHRLSTIRDCDEIVVLDKGQVVERGTHEELMKTGGYYSELISNE